MMTRNYDNLDDSNDDNNVENDDDYQSICRLACQMPPTLSTPVLLEATPTTRSSYHQVYTMVMIISSSTHTSYLSFFLHMAHFWL